LAQLERGWEDGRMGGWGDGRMEETMEEDQKRGRHSFVW
jgi:hypothetical protein